MDLCKESRVIFGLYAGLHLHEPKHELVFFLVQFCSVVKMGIQAWVSFFALVSEDWYKITWSEKKKNLHPKKTMQN